MSSQRKSSVNYKPFPDFTNKQKITVKGDYFKTAQRLHALSIFLIPLLGLIAAIILAVQVGVGAVDIWLFMAMYILTMIGITIGFHRYFAHRAFKTSTPVRVILAILGCMACQGPLIYWVGNHRRHHRYPDLAEDPHSPYLKGEKRLRRLQGLLHAHMGWTINHEITNTAVFAKDLLQDPIISKINRLYYVWIVLSLAIPTILGGVLTGTWIGALSGFLWGGLVRLFFSYHFTNSVNSITHVFGKRSFDTRDYSTNNIWLAVPTFGEAWHNNHHAFPSMAVFGMKWWQIDFGGWLIWALESLGLVWDVKSPSSDNIQSKMVK